MAHESRIDKNVKILCDLLVYRREKSWHAFPMATSLHRSHAELCEPITEQLTFSSSISFSVETRHSLTIVIINIFKRNCATIEIVCLLSSSSTNRCRQWMCKFVVRAKERQIERRPQKTRLRRTDAANSKFNGWIYLLYTLDANFHRQIIDSARFIRPSDWECKTTAGNNNNNKINKERIIMYSVETAAAPAI